MWPAQKGEGEGEGENPLTPLPLHFPLPFNPLPLSTSATQAIFNYDHRKKSSDLSDRRDYMEISLYYMATALLQKRLFISRT